MKEISIRCVAIVTLDVEGRIVEGQGRRKIVECGKRMYKTSEFTWQCSSGHTRKWPHVEWTALSMGKFTQL